jgi:hypothetical protein
MLTYLHIQLILRKSVSWIEDKYKYYNYHEILSLQVYSFF